MDSDYFNSSNSEDLNKNQMISNMNNQIFNDYKPKNLTWFIKAIKIYF